MKKIIIVLVMFILLLTVSGCVNNTNNTNDTNNKSNELGELKDEELISYVDSICKDYFNQKEMVGMSVGIIKDGKVSYLNYGKESVDGEATTENTIYEIASVSKTFTGTILADEVLRGNMALEDPVQKYIDFPFDDEYDGTTITIKNLATHTSTLPENPVCPGWHNPFKDYDKQKVYKYLEGFRIKSKPGVKYEYSNLGIGFLGCIIEDIENKPYEQLLDELITKQLGMESTKVILDEELHKRKATPYFAKNFETCEYDFNALKACGGINSCVRDMMRYVAANLGQLECDERLTNAFALAHQPHFESEEMSLGLAWHFTNTDNFRYIDHRGMTGGFRSYCGLYEEKGVGIVILCNCADAYEFRELGMKAIVKLAE